MKIVTCSACGYFIPDSIGFGDGIGICQSLDDYKKAVKAKDLPLRKHNELVTKAEVKLGIVPAKAKEPIRLLYPNAERVCEKYIQLKGN